MSDIHHRMGAQALREQAQQLNATAAALEEANKPKPDPRKEFREGGSTLQAMVVPLVLVGLLSLVTHPLIGTTVGMSSTFIWFILNDWRDRANSYVKGTIDQRITDAEGKALIGMFPIALGSILVRSIFVPEKVQNYILGYVEYLARDILPQILNR